MRTIKFRAWSTAENKMYLPEKTDRFTINFLGGVSYEGDTWADDMLLMQYTGVNDKNDTEIYEGDVLRKQRYAYGKKSGQSFHLVEWKNGALNHGFILPTGDIEIIGNTYEHPELLEKV